MIKFRKKIKIPKEDMLKYGVIAPQDKKPKEDIVDIKNISQLVDKQLLPRIGLVFNSDIKTNPKLAIYQDWTESQVQKFFKKSFDKLKYEIENKCKGTRIEFIQNDNGDSAGGNLTEIQRMALYGRKKAEGSRKGFPDITILVSRKEYDDNAFAIFCEVKKINAPSGIRLKQEQLDWFIDLNKMGFASYICNNIFFFENVILGKIKKVLE